MKSENLLLLAAAGAGGYSVWKHFSKPKVKLGQGGRAAKKGGGGRMKLKLNPKYRKGVARSLTSRPVLQAAPLREEFMASTLPGTRYGTRLDAEHGEWVDPGDSRKS